MGDLDMVDGLLAAIDPSAAEIESIIAPVYEAIAELSLVCAHAPRERTEPALQAIAAHLRATCGEEFAGVIDPDELDTIVANILDRIRERRDAIEAAAAGTA
jgi:hypothetical protein